MNTTALLGTKALKPTTPCKSVTLRGACGPGFGRGQLLVRLHRTDRTKPIVVERTFLPSTIDGNFTTKPFAWQTRAFNPDPKLLEDWTYAVAEVAVDSVSPPVFQLEYLSGATFVSAWEKLDLNLFQLDDITMARLSVITGLAFKNRKFKNRGGFIRNFLDADKIEVISKQGNAHVWRIREPQEPSAQLIREVKRHNGPKGHRRRHGGKSHQTAAPKPLNSLAGQLAGLQLPK